jgi:hypothetical protein
MNQNDKDKDAAENYMENSLWTVPDKACETEAFLAGIRYERNRQSEVVEMSFDEWFATFLQRSGIRDAKDGK